MGVIGLALLMKGSYLSEEFARFRMSVGRFMRMEPRPFGLYSSPGWRPSVELAKTTCRPM